MKYRDFTKLVARNAGVPAELAKLVIEAFTVSVVECIATGDKVTIRDFGTFKAVPIGERVVRDFSTGRLMTIPPHNGPQFKASDILKRVVRQ